MSRPPHSPWFDLPNDIWWWLQIMKVPIVQLSPVHFQEAMLNRVREGVVLDFRWTHHKTFYRELFECKADGFLIQMTRHSLN
jgi:hypothetical protein